MSVFFDHSYVFFLNLYKFINFLNLKKNLNIIFIIHLKKIIL